MFIFRDLTPERYGELSAEQRRQLLDRWNDWYEGLVNSGRAQHGAPLESAGKVLSGVRGEKVTDGPFAEATEGVAGYFFLTVADMEEATEIARRCPNLPYGMSIEIRPVAGACHLARSIGRTTMRAVDAS
jgi:Uncharacterized protein conserved in bacteria